MKHLQMLAQAWAIRAFGNAHVTDPRLRALRLLEEAIELAQAEGVARHLVDHCTEVVYSRPVGIANQEIGGVMMTAAIYCGCKGLELDDVLMTELNRVLSKPLEQFTKRNQDKINLGLT